MCLLIMGAARRTVLIHIIIHLIALGDYMDLQVHACVGGTAVRDDMCTI